MIFLLVYCIKPIHSSAQVPPGFFISLEYDWLSDACKQIISFNNTCKQSQKMSWKSHSLHVSCNMSIHHLRPVQYVILASLVKNALLYPFMLSFLHLPILTSLSCANPHRTKALTLGWVTWLTSPLLLHSLPAEILSSPTKKHKNKIKKH